MITMRPAAEEDRELLRRTHHAAYRDVTVRQFGSWDPPRQDDYFEASWRAGGLTIILVDTMPCGYCQVELRGHDVHLRELVLAPDFQGRGIGTAVVRTVQRQARRLGVPLHLGTLRRNRAVALYRRLGFVECGSTETHLLMEWRPEDGSSDREPDSK